MKNASLLLLSIIVLIKPICAFSDEKLENFRVNVFANHALNKLKNIQNEILKCPHLLKNDFDFYFEIENERVRYEHSERRDIESLNFALVSEVKINHYFKNSKCKKVIENVRINEILKERKPFEKAYQLFGSHLNLMNELAPWCAIDQIKNIKGSIDTNPCFAGENLVMNDFGDLSEISLKIDAFLNIFEEKIKTVKNGTSLDLKKIFISSQLTKNAEIFATLAYFYTSSTSNIGWVDGYGKFIYNHYLVNDPYLTTQSASIIEYFNWKNRKDLFNKLLLKSVPSKNIQLTFGDTSLKNWNRHNIMAAFLACHYTTKNEPHKAALLPEVLGIAYESKDFISHLKDGVDFVDSLKNFKTDTDRYRKGMQLGLESCK